MARATMSLLGMYRSRPDLLDELALPAAIEEDRDLITDNLLIETAELEILYSDAEFLKYAIGSWSRKQVGVWDELYKTTQYEYNPIWNKDGVVTESHVISRNKTGNENSTMQGSSQFGTSDSTQGVHSVFGFNSAEEAPESTDKTNSDGHGSNSGTSSSQTNMGENETVTDTVTREEKGNIGSTTTQHMIQEQRESVRFNIFDIIIEEFKTRFCLLIY